ncbi:MAG: hypothetical protein RBT80_19220 [Candidatus Vecturithrix sp.]|jgi:hypothetical protein|nr:hypothetical protein [Candidatus Vecturithrix sp.]
MKQLFLFDEHGHSLVMPTVQKNGILVELEQLEKIPLPGLDEIQSQILRNRVELFLVRQRIMKENTLWKGTNFDIRWNHESVILLNEELIMLEKVGKYLEEERQLIMRKIYLQQFV